MITGAQIRMARGYLKLSARNLAEQSGVAESTIKRMELDEGIPNATGPNIAKVQSTLEAAGIVFLFHGDTASGPGVSLRRD